MALALYLARIALTSLFPFSSIHQRYRRLAKEISDILPQTSQSARHRKENTSVKLSADKLFKMPGIRESQTGEESVLWTPGLELISSFFPPAIGALENLKTKVIALIKKKLDKNKTSDKPAEATDDAAAATAPAATTEAAKTEDAAAPAVATEAPAADAAPGMSQRAGQGG